MTASHRPFRRLVSVLVVPALLALAGCGSAKPATSTAPAAQTPAPAAQAPAAQPKPADDWPKHEIRIIVPSSAGGGIDTAARSIQPYWEKELGVPLVVENRPGGNSVIGQTMIADAAGDGYTIGNNSSPQLEFTMINQEAKYTQDSFDYIGGYNFDPGVIRVHKDAPYNTFKEWIDWVKTKPAGSVTVSVSVMTSSNALGLKLIEEAAGVKFNIVPFKGGNEARLAVVSKQVDATHTQAFGSLNIAKDSKVIAVQFAKNNWPTITNNAKTVNEEMGWKLADTGSGYLFLISSKVKKEHPERFQKLVETYKRAFENPEFRKKMQEAGVADQLRYSTPEDLTAQVKANMLALPKYKDVLKD